MSTDSAQTVVFPRLQRQGWAFGLTKPQLVWMTIAVGGVLLSTPMGATRIFQTILFFAIPIVGLALAQIDQRPAITVFAEGLMAVVRRAAGKTRYQVAPEGPIKKGRLTIPGAVGARIEVLEVPYGSGAAVLLDKAARTATVVLRTESGGFDTASDDDRAGRVGGYARLASALLTHPGVVRVATMARTIPTPPTAALEFYEQTAASRGGGAAASPWAHEQVLAQLSDPNQVSVSRDVLVVVTVAIGDVKALIQDAGGRKVGLGHVMAREVSAISGLLTAAGATSKRWLNPAEITGVIRAAYDPSTIESISANPDGLDLADAAPTAVEESWDMMRTDGAVHRTMWIRQWPRTETQVGFLSDLIGSGNWSRTITQVFCPEPIHKTARAIQVARGAIASRQQVDELLKRPASYETKATTADLEAQEAELAEGFAGIRFTGYVTVHADSDEELRLAANEADRAADGLELRTLYGQQAAAFAAAALPLGWGLTT